MSSSTSCRVEWDLYKNRLSEVASHLFTQNTNDSSLQAFSLVGTAILIASTDVFIADLSRTEHYFN
jgi:hypothetical protein